MTNPQPTGFDIPDKYGLRAELIPHEDDAVTSRNSVTQILEQQTVGLWVRQVLEDFTNNWLFRIVLRCKAVRDGTKKHCIVACGGGNDILVQFNTTEMPPNFSSIPKIGIEVCLASGRQGEPIDRTDPITYYGSLHGTQALRDFVCSEFSTGATQVRVFIDTGEDAFVDVTQGTIDDKRVVRFKTVEGIDDWKVDRVFHVRAVKEVFFPPAAPVASPARHRQPDKSPSSRQKGAETAAAAKRPPKKAEAADAKKTDKNSDAASQQKKKPDSNSTETQGDETGNKVAAAADVPKKRKKTDDDAEPVEEEGSATPKKPKARSLCACFPYCKMYADQCGGRTTKTCREVNEGRVVIPEGVDLKKEKRRAKARLEKELKEKAAKENKEASSRETTEGDEEDPTGKETAQEETPKEPEKDEEPTSKEGTSKKKKRKKKKAHETETDNGVESNKKPKAASKKRKETETENNEDSTVEKNKSKKKSKVNESEEAESTAKSSEEELSGRDEKAEDDDDDDDDAQKDTTAKKNDAADDDDDDDAQNVATNDENDAEEQVPEPDLSEEALSGLAQSSKALCYYFPYCKSHAEDCGGMHRGVCKEVNMGRVKLPPTEEEFESVKKKGKSRIKYFRKKVHAEAAAKSAKAEAAKNKEGDDDGGSDNSEAAAKSSEATRSNEGDEGDGSDNSTVTEQQSPKRPAKTAPKKPSGDVSSKKSTGRKSKKSRDSSKKGAKS